MVRKPPPHRSCIKFTESAYQSLSHRAAESDACSTDLVALQDPAFLHSARCRSARGRVCVATRCDFIESELKFAALARFSSE